MCIGGVDFACNRRDSLCAFVRHSSGDAGCCSSRNREYCSFHAADIAAASAAAEAVSRREPGVILRSYEGWVSMLGVECWRLILGSW
jgi:hypothetical protein